MASGPQRDRRIGPDHDRLVAGRWIGVAVPQAAVEGKAVARLQFENPLADSQFDAARQQSVVQAELLGTTHFGLNQLLKERDEFARAAGGRRVFAKN